MNELESIIEQVLGRVELAREKFPTWPTDPRHALVILGEEFGELSREVNQLCDEPWKESSPKTVSEEALDTAAMSIRFLLSLAKYDYKKGPQHKQMKTAMEVE